MARRDIEKHGVVQGRGDPFSGVIYVFRAKRADRLKLLYWDGTGVVLVAKTLEQGGFRWPKVQDGVMRLTAKSPCLPSRDERAIVTETLIWRGVTVEIAFEADWNGSAARGSELAYAHLEVRVVSPEKAPLPITETGYRSHFIDIGVVEAGGGPADYVAAWLDDTAKSKAWRKAESRWRQLDLFE